MSVVEASADEDYVLDEQVGYLMRLATQRHTAIFQAHAPAGLTPTQFSALIRLADEGPCSQNHLGRLAAMDIATIKGVVDRLRQKDLVQAASSPEDKRRLILSLTPKGQALAQELRKAGGLITEETLAPLSGSERRALLTLLRKLI
ncbi:MAG: MarR family transcriptional regulator [Pseudomonadota bacterium]